MSDFDLNSWLCRHDVFRGVWWALGGMEIHVRSMKLYFCSKVSVVWSYQMNALAKMPFKCTKGYSVCIVRVRTDTRILLITWTPTSKWLLVCLRNNPIDYHNLFVIFRSLSTKPPIANTYLLSAYLVRDAWSKLHIYQLIYTISKIGR